MKKIYLALAAICCFSTAALAQKKNLTSAASFVYGTSFSPEDTIIYRYHSATGFDTELETWNADTVAYFTVSPASLDAYELSTYTNNKVTLRTNIFFAGPNVFTSRTYYYYTPGGKVDYYITASNIGMTNDSSRVTYTYNTQGDVTGWLKERWNNSSMQWQNDSRNTYNYSGGLLQSNVQELWDNSNMVWEGTVRYSYQYASGKLQSQVSEQYSSSGWENWQRNDYTYDVNGHRYKTTFYLWYPSSVAWGEQHYMLDTNSATGELLSSTTFVPTSSGYEPDNRTEYTYNTDKQMTRSLELVWDNINFQFTHTSGNQEWHYHYGETVGINDAPTTPQIPVSVYPVPATNTLFVDAIGAAGKPLTLSMYDVSGKQVKAISINNAKNTLHSVDVSGLPSGNYMLQVRTGAETTIHRFSIQ
jgi:hypothetical protein